MAQYISKWSSNGFYKGCVSVNRTDGVAAVVAAVRDLIAVSTKAHFQKSLSSNVNK